MFTALFLGEDEGGQGSEQGGHLGGRDEKGRARGVGYMSSGLPGKQGPHGWSLDVQFGRRAGSGDGKVFLA